MFFSVILISVLSVTTIGFPRNWQVDMVCVCKNEIWRWKGFYIIIKYIKMVNLLLMYI